MVLTYRMEGDYQIPNLTMPEEPEMILGKYALMREQHLKQNNRVFYINLLTSGKLNAHLMETEQSAAEMMDMLVPRMAAEQGVTEKLKAADQMKWVGLMNNIHHSAEEVILKDLIYA